MTALTRRRWIIAAGHSLAVLAAGPLAAHAQQPQSYRSVNDGLPRQVDELDRPFWRETQSHRGWEIREDQYTVFANTSQNDARWATVQVKEAWSSTAGLADYWTQIHRQPNFGLNSTQIVIDNEPAGRRNGPLTTVNVVGIQTQVYINVAAGQPALEQQVLQLREGAAFALLHTTGLDSAAPPWVVQGLASVAAEQSLEPAALAAAKKSSPAARFGGQQWRYERSLQDQLDYPALAGDLATAKIEFLLQGDDAEHAPALLAAITDGWKAAEKSAALGRNYRGHPGDPQLPPVDSAFDQLIADRKSQFAAWQRDPLAGQPIFEPDPKLSPDVLQAQREMLVLLKLQRRFADPVASGKLRARVVEFHRDTGANVIDASLPASSRPPATIGELYSRLTAPGAPAWGTLDVHGKLLLSTDRQRLDELFARHEQRYAVIRDAKRSGLSRTLEGGQRLEGWLEANPENAARPLARFTIIQPRPTRVRTTNVSLKAPAQRH